MKAHGVVFFTPRMPDGQEQFRPMMHSSPMPLAIVLDMCKRLQHDLSKHMTPEQKRDFARMERLISEAQSRHVTDAARLKQQAGLAAAARQPERRGFWS